MERVPALIHPRVSYPYFSWTLYHRVGAQVHEGGGNDRRVADDSWSKQTAKRSRIRLVEELLAYGLKANRWPDFKVVNLG